MNIMERVSDLYEECGMDMFSDISTYLTYGYMHKTPTSFILAKTVDKDSETPPAEQWDGLKPNAWFVHMAVGVKELPRGQRDEAYRYEREQALPEKRLSRLL